MPKFDDSMTSQEAWSSALEEAAVSCWRRVSCVEGGTSGLLEEASGVHWRRR